MDKQDYAKDDGLLGPREWLILGVVLLGAYLYNRFAHRLRAITGGFTLGSGTGATIVGGTALTEEDACRRSHVLEARRRLIEETERRAEANRAKIKEREEQKRKEKLERKERLLDITKVPSTSTDKGKSTLRGDDYNPLMGSGGGGSCGWRPTRRGPARGG
ncbi:selenoprotein S-like [Tropilaelaps mercedesae]|uniref:Selenoprotein S-like n=1 Tax=Tropilaelaps mercedesae TaxID=418985 RepID=A0A1V9XNZ7_9ACAR|nr:selenoprotein S-like [Tropilaelaps mercedesae]